MKQFYAILTGANIQYGGGPFKNIAVERFVSLDGDDMSEAKESLKRFLDTYRSYGDIKGMYSSNRIPIIEVCDAKEFFVSDLAKELLDAENERHRKLVKKQELATLARLQKKYKSASD